jgi:hypothetical protein
MRRRCSTPSPPNSSACTSSLARWLSSSSDATATFFCRLDTMPAEVRTHGANPPRRLLDACMQAGAAVDARPRPNKPWSAPWKKVPQPHAFARIECGGVGTKMGIRPPRRSVAARG